MLLGILSDTHGKTQVAQRAIDLILARKCDFFIHCGDLGDHVIELLPVARSAFVFGNNDFDRAHARSLAKSLEITCLEDSGTLELSGHKVHVSHGDRPGLYRPLLVDQTIDYLLTGHTHVAHDSRTGRVRLINPGALYRATPRTIAVLDLASDLLEFIEVAP